MTRPASFLKAPFPYFGGKSSIAATIWEVLGDVKNYVEPFVGSAAVLLARPSSHAASCIETINDACGFVSNFWRAVQQDPEAVAYHTDWPVNENDLHAVHIWLITQAQDLPAKLEGNLDYYDVRIAGKWCWGLCCWIGSGWCSGRGPWGVADGRLAHLGDAGRGVQRKLVHLGDAGQENDEGGSGTPPIQQWMQALCHRLRRVRVCCGDWTRVLGPSVTYKHGLSGIVLDPPYAQTERDDALYAEDGTFTEAVHAWCLANGDNPLLRIALCGYDGEYVLPGWRCVPWKANGGMSNQNCDRDNQNKYRERLWLSPHCLEPQLSLFGG